MYRALRDHYARSEYGLFSWFLDRLIGDNAAIGSPLKLTQAFAKQSGLYIQDLIIRLLNP